MASGNERTAISFPAGYGYRLRWYDSWNLLVDLMNHSTTSKTVYVPAQGHLPSLLGVGEAAQAGLAGHRPVRRLRVLVPAGYSDTHRDWTVRVPGKAVAMLGHVHGHGIAVEATNENLGGASICRSVATLDPIDVHSVLPCRPAPATRGPS